MVRRFFVGCWAMSVVEEKEEKKTKEPKGEKLRLGAKSEMPSLLWLCHLRQMIKEADPALLKDVEVIRELNALVDLMTENVQHIWSNIARGQDKYRKSFALEDGADKDPVAGLCTITYQSVYQPSVGDRWYYRSRFGRSAEDRQKEIALRDQVVALYRPLWERVRGAVEPYMAERVREVDDRNRLKRLESLVGMLETEEARYQEEKRRLELAVTHLTKTHEERATRRRAEIARLSAMDTTAANAT